MVGGRLPEASRVVVAHYHEIGLKGKNRSFFERTLAENIRFALEGTGFEKVRSISGRLLVLLGDSSDVPQILERLSRVFGLSSFSPARVIRPQTMDDLIGAAVAEANDAKFETFAVRARKGHSSFDMSSQQINVAVGQAIKDSSGASVHLDDPQWTCHIELVEDMALIYSDRLQGPGGLPVGSSGKALALLSGGIDSPVASWRIARRGAAVDFIHFHGQPFSDASSVHQATKLAHQLKRWIPRPKLWLVPFGDIQSEIVTEAEERLRIVLYRRFMMRIAEAIGLGNGHGALITGESLGQVASQTLPNMAVIESVVQSLPVLRPLVGNDKIEIEQMAKHIGTYEISTEPHQDCCVLFVPRKVTTSARLENIERAEQSLDVGALVEKGVANASVMKL